MHDSCVYKSDKMHGSCIYISDKIQDSSKHPFHKLYGKSQCNSLFRGNIALAQKNMKMELNSSNQNEEVEGKG